MDLIRLDSLDFQTLDAAATLAALVALDRQRGRLDSLQERLLAQLCATDPSADRWCAEEVSVALRREGLTQEAAARLLGVSVKTVSRWVGGATEPRLRDLRRIQEVFGEIPLQ